MLKILVPIALEYEMKDNSAQQARTFGNKIGISTPQALELVHTFGRSNTHTIPPTPTARLW